MVYSIYKLGDPRYEATVRYVGLSKNVFNRFAQHILGISGSHNERKAAWIEELKQAGFLPLLEVLESGIESRSLAGEREAYWIDLYTRAGADLLNRFNRSDTSCSLPSVGCSCGVAREIAKGLGYKLLIRNLQEGCRVYAYKENTLRIGRSNISVYIMSFEEMVHHTTPEKFRETIVAKLL